MGEESAAEVPWGTISGRADGGGTRQLSDTWYRLPNPSTTNDLDDELEVGVVINKEGCNMRETEWLDDVAGFTIFNDWSCRDLWRDEMAANLGPPKGTVTGGTVSEAMCNGLPAPWRRPGDVVEVDVEGIGVLRNKVAPPEINDPDHRCKAAVKV